jgi:hypothetical protein
MPYRKGDKVVIEVEVVDASDRSNIRLIIDDPENARNRIDNYFTLSERALDLGSLRVFATTPEPATATLGVSGYVVVPKTQALPEPKPQPVIVEAPEVVVAEPEPVGLPRRRRGRR